MTSRRGFLAGSAAIGAFAAVEGRAAKTSSNGFQYTEFEARIARRDQPECHRTSGCTFEEGPDFQFRDR
jgi:hypothetical protein